MFGAICLYVFNIFLVFLQSKAGVWPQLFQSWKMQSWAQNPTMDPG